MARHIYDCPMRWSDMDALRHVNNVVYLRYLEDARIDWLYKRGAFERTSGEGVMVVHHDIDYHRQLSYRHRPVPVELWVSRIGNASFAVSAEVVDTGTDGERVVYARATTVLATVDLQEGHPKRVSRELRHYLEQFVE